MNNQNPPLPIPSPPATFENKMDKNWLKRQYDRILFSATTPQAVWIVCLISFAESSFFPLPPDLLLIPMILANRHQAWRLAGLCTVTSVVGGLLGYAIGYYLYASVGEWVIRTYDLTAAFNKFQLGFAEWGFWIIVLKGLTPIPYKLVTIASGVAHFDLKIFMVASLIARGFRFYLLSGLLWWGGPWMRHYIEKYLGLFLSVTLGIILLGFIILKYLV